jgi:hypothetical protein
LPPKVPAAAEAGEAEEQVPVSARAVAARAEFLAGEARVLGALALAAALAQRVRAAAFGKAAVVVRVREAD